MNGLPKRQLVTLLIALPALAGVLVLAGSAVATPSISSRRAEAQQAIEQIDQMDAKIEEVGNRWQGAQYHLKLTKAKLGKTRFSLALARKSLGVSRHTLAQRVISVYTEQGEASDSTVAILFQATSLRDMIDRIEASQRISDHDAQVVKQVKALRDRTAAQAAALEKMQTRQQALADQISSEWNALKSKQAERKAYVARVKQEIASLVAERNRQAELEAAQARRTVSSYSSTPSANLPDYVAPASSSVGEAVVRAAMSRLNAPYVWGAAGPNAFDCSGLVVWAFAQVNIGLPHYSYSQMTQGVAVSASDLQPGDLVFFSGGSHVGIYVGGGQFIHAPYTGTVVRVNSLSSHGSLTAARRIG